MRQGLPTGNGAHKPGRFSNSFLVSFFYSRAWLIAAVYGLFATLWIYFSDSALHFIADDQQRFLEWSVYKGFAFVTVTTLLLLLLVRQFFGKIESGYKRLKEQEIELNRITNLYAALSQINQAIVWAKTREELLQKICEILTGFGGFRLAWIGWHDPENSRLVPVASCGDENGYLQAIRIHTDDRPEGKGPSGTAFRENRSYICNDMLKDPATLPWRAEARHRKLHASASFPIRIKAQPQAILSVYATETGFFKDKEVALLEEAASDISYALENFQRAEEHRQAEVAARNEKLFSETMIESMPGILYFYNEQGKFLRWNKNFETVSGYSASEIAGMHPLHFFSADDKRSLEERIREVFEKGESSIEASFLCKDGSTIPYFFTGKRVVFEGETCLVGVGIDLSARKQAETALREAEVRFHTLFEQTPAGVAVIDPGDTTIIECNEQAAKQLGYSSSELSSMVLSDIEADNSTSDTRNRIKALLIEGRGEFETRHRTRSGEIRDIFVSGHIIELSGRKVLHCVFFDITERKLAEQALRESLARFDAVARATNDAVWDWNLADKTIWWNENFRKHFGYRPEEIEPGIESWTSRVHPEDRDRVVDSIHSVINSTGTLWSEEYRFRCGDGSYADVLDRGLVLRDDKGVGCRMVGAIQDITNRKKTEQSLRELNENLESKVAERTAELKSALIRAEASDKLKSAFLATMSHELRTPLNSIIGFTGIVLQELPGPLNPEQAKQLGMVRNSARHLLELINDVLDLSKIEAGQLEVSKESFDLPASIQKVISLVTPLADKKDLHLECLVSPELTELFNDRRRVEQILINLLNNAIKFTDRGRVTLSAEKIENFQCTPESKPGPGVRIQVIDTGIGIKPDDLSGLFQPFRQVDSGITRQHEGTGLGLAICRKLCNLIGGKITVSSKPAEGSVFTVDLPLEPPSGISKGVRS